jgi:hypothetical protein
VTAAFAGFFNFAQILCKVLCFVHTVTRLRTRRAQTTLNTMAVGSTDVALPAGLSMLNGNLNGREKFQQLVTVCFCLSSIRQH